MNNKMTRIEAKNLAVEALNFIVRDEKLLQRFLELTGIGAHDLRQSAAEPGFFAAILGFLCANEQDLYEFCVAVNIDPEHVGVALSILPGGYQEDLL